MLAAFQDSSLVKPVRPLISACLSALQDNRHLFKAPVHDPIMLCLDVKDRSYANYVETHVGRADLEGFVCEDPDDVNLLLKKLREEMKLRKINAFHSNPEKPSAFSKPYSNEDLVKYDLDCYIREELSSSFLLLFALMRFANILKDCHTTDLVYFFAWLCKLN
jgi:hypothetical protein